MTRMDKQVDARDRAVKQAEQALDQARRTVADASAADQDARARRKDLAQRAFVVYIRLSEPLRERVRLIASSSGSAFA